MPRRSEDSSGSETADPDTPEQSEIERESDHSEPGNEAYDSGSDWSLASRHATPPPVDDRLDACYHAIFGVAAWDRDIAANLRLWPAFKREHFFYANMRVETLQDFYRDFWRVLRIFQHNNFIDEYEDAYRLKTGIRIDFLAPTSRPDHVNTREALKRLYCLYHAITEHGPRVAAHEIAQRMHEHENDTSALDRAILEYLKPHRRREPFDPVDAWVNENPAYDVSAVAPPGADEHNKENREPSPPPRAAAPRATRPASTPRAAAPAAREPLLWRPRARMPAEAHVAALLSRLRMCASQPQADVCI
jgi:hypothetical protein